MDGASEICVKYSIETLKEALYAQRVELPELDILTRELKELRMIKGKKVDHPTNGSKDVTDAVADALYSHMQNGGLIQVSNYRQFDLGKR